MAALITTPAAARAYLLELFPHDAKLVEEYVDEAVHQEGEEVFGSATYAFGEPGVIRKDFEIYREHCLD